MPICVIGDTADLSAVYLAWAARRAGREVLELDEARMGAAWWFALHDASPRDGWLEMRDRRVRLADLDGAFVRFSPDASAGFGLSGRDAEIFRGERRAAINRLVDALDCPVANNPRSARANGSKPLQMRQLALAGFDVPSWVVTNDPAAAAEFVATAGGDCVYKSVSGLRTRVRAADRELAARLRAGTTPVVVQQRIAGRDVRIHTVGDRVFATELTAAGVDYRFDGVSAYRAVDAPPGVAELCLTVAHDEGMVLGGFDFRVDADGRWWCLELNPMPSFIPYQMATGQPIGEALLDLFAARAPQSA